MKNSLQPSRWRDQGSAEPAQGPVTRSPRGEGREVGLQGIIILTHFEPASEKIHLLDNKNRSLQAYFLPTEKEQLWLPSTFTQS